MIATLINGGEEGNLSWQRTQVLAGSKPSCSIRIQQGGFIFPAADPGRLPLGHNAADAARDSLRQTLVRIHDRMPFGWKAPKLQGAPRITPGRKMVGMEPVRSTTVDSMPTEQDPPSTIRNLPLELGTYLLGRGWGESVGEGWHWRCQIPLETLDDSLHQRVGRPS